MPLWIVVIAPGRQPERASTSEVARDTATMRSAQSQSVALSMVS
jgi:hypothetical protein